MAQENNRQIILETSLKLFSSKGYDSVGVQEICQACGITKPTLYYYFQSKLGLLEAIIEDYGSLMVEKLGKAAAYDHDFVKHLTDTLNAQIKFACSHPDFFLLYNALNVSAVQNQSYEAVSKLKAKINGIYLKLFKDSVEIFGNMKGYEKLFSASFQAVVNSTTLSVLEKSLTPDDDTIYRIIRSFVYGVAN